MGDGGHCSQYIFISDGIGSDSDSYAWASGLGDWGECEADDDDDFDEPGAWRDSVALDDCDA